MIFESLEIADLVVITPERFRDDRGFLSETYNKRSLAEAGIDVKFLQDNHARSVEKGVVRGLHFQIPPHAQNKLVRVAQGSILDVAVDIRRGSPTFGKHVAITLSAENWRQLWVPEGFAHGYCTLEPNTEVIYKVTDYYAPKHDYGLAWDDPDLGIEWPVSPDEAVLSLKDKSHPTLNELPGYFTYTDQRTCGSI